MQPSIKKHSDMTEDEKQIDAINNMSQLEMARLWRFAPSGHPWFDSSKPFFKHFEERFQKLGGFTPEISKRLGW